MALGPGSTERHEPPFEPLVAGNGSPNRRAIWLYINLRTIGHARVRIAGTCPGARTQPLRRPGDALSRLTVSCSICVAARPISIYASRRKDSVTGQLPGSDRWCSQAALGGGCGAAAASR
jgi:hypothetical protein